MLKILNTAQIKEWDLFTIKNEPITSIDLMERACLAFVNWFTEKFDASKKVGVVCGTGNNGGDGLGIARILSERGYTVAIWIVKGGVPDSIDFGINKKRLPDRVSYQEIASKPNSGIFANSQIIIDGIFGSGLSRKLEGLYKEVVEEINNSKAVTVAIDIPSGLFADQATDGIAVEADFTITFQIPKLAFLLPDNEKYIGEWEVINIGLHKVYLKETSTTNFLIDKKAVRSMIARRGKFAHKGDFGKALLIAGSLGKMGACILAARSALKSGVGLLTLHVPKCGYEIVQSTVPEAMASVDDSDSFFSSVPEIVDFTALGIGPGLGQNPNTKKALKNLLNTVDFPIVIDADGLNILASDSSVFHLLPGGSILTPHPGELKRLMGDWKNDFEKLNKAKELAARTKCIIVIKGAYSTIVSPDGSLYFNSTGNPGMATGGSGDVLTGIITGLVAQKIDPLRSAIIGVFIHGFAGDLAAFGHGQISLTASDIINELPQAFKQVSG